MPVLGIPAALSIQQPSTHLAATWQPDSPGAHTMANSSRVDTVKTEELPADLLELTALIATLSAEQRGRLQPVLDRVVESTKRRRRILSLVQDALSQLRLDMKYLVFDLEATRRERDAYRQQLEEGTNLGDELLG